MSRKKFDRFCFGDSLDEVINSLPEEYQLRYFKYIVNYGLKKIDPPSGELPGLEKTVWIQIRNIIDITRPKKGGQPGNGNAAKDDDGPDTGTGGPEAADGTNETNGNEGERTETNETNGNEGGNININVNDNINVNKNKKENGNGNPPPFSFPPFLNQSFSEPPCLPDKNYAAVFEKVKAKWKEITGQETRESLLTVSPVKREKFIHTLADYSLDDIFNAIGNYHLARSHPEKFDIGGRTYGSLIGFLENGVRQFFTDDIVNFNFRKEKK
jgi:hypothetical protein